MSYSRGVSVGLVIGAGLSALCSGENAAAQSACLDEDKVLASNGGAGDRLGWSIGVSGDTLISGAPFADHPGGSDQGSAYIFMRAGALWTEQGELIASDRASGDWFGYSTSIDGDTAVVGARNGGFPGAAYVFTRSGTVWSEQSKLLAASVSTGAQFGISVSVCGDTAVVGARWDNEVATQAGAAYVFTRTGVTWTEQAKLTASDGAEGDQFGVSIGVHGDTVVVGANADDDDGNFSGSAYVFTRTGTTWTEQTKLTAADGASSDGFGWSVSVDGDSVLVGAIGDADAGSNTGAAYVFTRSGTTWSEQAKLTAADAGALDQFGERISLSGDLAVVGAPFNDGAASDEGAAYVFSRDGTTWSQASKITASDGGASERFGTSVGIDGALAVVGASFEDSAGALGGAAYAYDGAAGFACVLGDLNGDGVIDGADLAALLAGWGLGGETDLNNDGATDGADLAILLANWSP